MLERYKLLEKIGEGGFGEVWMAEQPFGSDHVRDAVGPKVDGADLRPRRPEHPR